MPKAPEYIYKILVQVKDVEKQLVYQCNIEPILTNGVVYIHSGDLVLIHPVHNILFIRIEKHLKEDNK